MSQEAAGERLQKFGANELTEKPRPGFLALLWDQFNNYLVIILIVAAILAALLGEYVDSIAIMCIVVLNAVIGVIQESKAEQALAALKKMAAPNAQVIRDGLSGDGSVPGAGARRHRAAGSRQLRACRYAPGLDRESEGRGSLADRGIGPVEKNATLVLDKEAGLGDRKNSAFLSTMVTYGRGKGLVIGTGMRTQIGLIAEMIQSYEEEATPLQQKLEHWERCSARPASRSAWSSSSTGSSGIHI